MNVTTDLCRDCRKPLKDAASRRLGQCIGCWNQDSRLAWQAKTFAVPYDHPTRDSA